MTGLTRWFRRRETLPISSKEIADALRGAAGLADDEETRADLTLAADAMDRAISRAARSGDKGIRDDVTYALMRAGISLRSQLTDLIETVKEQTIAVQGEQAERQLLASAIYDLAANQQRMTTAVAEQVAALGRQERAMIALRSEFERLNGEITIEIARLKKRDEGHEQRLDAIDAYHQRADGLRSGMLTRLDAIDAQIGVLIGLMRTVEEGAEMLQRHEEIIARFDSLDERADEAGG